MSMDVSFSCPLLHLHGVFFLRILLSYTGFLLSVGGSVV